MTYFIEKDHKWLTRDLTWTKYYTEAEYFSTPERALKWAKAMNISGYIITEHDLPKKDVIGVPLTNEEKNFIKVKFKENYGLLEPKNPIKSIIKRIKSFFTIISQDNVSKAISEGINKTNNGE